MESFKDIIDAIGVARVAEVCSTEESHVRTMKARDSIAPEYWSAIVEEAARIGLAGVNHELLLRLRSDRFSRVHPDPAS